MKAAEQTNRKKCPVLSKLLHCNNKTYTKSVAFTKLQPPFQTDESLNIYFNKIETGESCLLCSTAILWNSFIQKWSSLHILSDRIIFSFSLHKILYKLYRAICAISNAWLIWVTGVFFHRQELSGKEYFIDIYFNQHFNKHTGSRISPVSFP